MKKHSVCFNSMCNLQELSISLASLQPSAYEHYTSHFRVLNSLVTLWHIAKLILYVYNFSASNSNNLQAPKSSKQFDIGLRRFTVTKKLNSESCACFSDRNDMSCTKGRYYCCCTLLKIYDSLSAQCGILLSTVDSIRLPQLHLISSLST